MLIRKFVIAVIFNEYSFCIESQKCFSLSSSGQQIVDYISCLSLLKSDHIAEVFQRILTVLISVKGLRMRQERKQKILSTL